MKRHSKVFKVPQWYLIYFNMLYICFTVPCGCLSCSCTNAMLGAMVPERGHSVHLPLGSPPTWQVDNAPNWKSFIRWASLGIDAFWIILILFMLGTRATLGIAHTFHLAKIRRERARQGIRVPTASQPVTLLLFFAQDFFQSFDDLRKRFCKPSSTPSGHIWPLQLQSDHEFCGTQLLTSSKTKSTTHVSTLSFMCSSTASCPICCMKKFSPIRGNTRCLGSVWIVQMFVKFCRCAGISKLGTSPAVAKEGPTPVGVPVVTPWLARPAKVQANLVINQPQWQAKTWLLWAEECYNATT